MSSVPVRRSGLQQEVINLYRQCFRAVRLKPELRFQIVFSPDDVAKFIQRHTRTIVPLPPLNLTVSGSNTLYPPWNIISNPGTSVDIPDIKGVFLLTPRPSSMAPKVIDVVGTDSGENDALNSMWY
ncbi:hypothetical protein BX616_000629 [Lobosporangium transversale]|nr:hypothetical protein BX616_000629 [Lobosporangium transversale]